MNWNNNKFFNVIIFCTWLLLFVTAKIHACELPSGSRIEFQNSLSQHNLNYYQEADLSSLKRALQLTISLEHPYYCKTLTDVTSCDSKKLLDIPEIPVPQEWSNFLDRLQIAVFGKSLYSLKFCTNCGSTYSYLKPQYHLYLDMGFFEVKTKTWNDFDIAKFFIAHEIAHYIQHIAIDQKILIYPASGILDHNDVDTIALIILSQIGEPFPEGIIDFLEYIKTKQEERNYPTEEINLRIQVIKQTKNKLFPK